MASDRSRSKLARDLAEEALIRLALALGNRSGSIVVIGGLNPEYLTHSPPAPHLGTTDVDILLEVGFVYDRQEMDFSWLEAALNLAGFLPGRGAARAWRWTTRVNGMRVTLELLCDTPDSPGLEIVLPGCETVVAQNLQGPRPAIYDTVARTLEVPPRLLEEFPEAPTEVIVHFAGLGGYVMSKAAAVVARGQDKDFYDLPFVLLYNDEGGPRAAARAVDAVMHQDTNAAFESQVVAALKMYQDEHSRPASIFAEQMRLSGDPTDVEVLAQDAVGAAITFMTEFRTLGR